MPAFEYEKRGNYAIFTMNRPERLNALGREMNEGREAALADFNADPEMRAGILTGTGRAFCAGADLKEMANRDATTGHAFQPDSGHGTMIERSIRWSASPKPIIAAINGLCLGGGLETAIDCDIRICSTNAWFALPEPSRGIMAGYGTQNLTRVIGMSPANYVLLTGDRIEPQQAKDWGIVTEVLEPDELMPRATEIAEMIAANAPLAVQGTKAAIRSWRMAGVHEQYRMHNWLGKVVLESEDSVEGPRAFTEKRAPVWKGR